MKAMKRILSFIIVAVFMFAMSATAFADTQTIDVGGGTTTDGKIVIGNAQEGRTYTLYKLFDANGEEGNKVLYSLPQGKTLAAPATDWFEVDTVNNTIKAKDALTDAVMQSDDFETWAKGFGTVVGEANGYVATASGASTSSTSNAIEFTNVPYGYYMVFVQAAQGETNFAGKISVDTTNKVAQITDKNGQPHYPEQYGKKIADGEDADAPSGSYGIDQWIPYEVKISAMNVNNAKPVAGKPAVIYSYYVFDSINEYMTYENAAEVFVDGTKVSSNLRYTFFTVPYEEIMNWCSDPANAGATWADVKTQFASKITTDISKAQSFRLDIPWRANITDIENIPEFVDANGDGKHDTTGQNAEEFYGAPMYASNAKLVLKYKAKLDSKKITDPAIIATLTFDNKAGFAYYDQTMDPDIFQPVPPTGIAPEQKASNYTVDLILNKVDENGNALTGATFTLKGTGLTVTRVEKETFTVDAAGDYWKLKNGKYTTDDPTTGNFTLSDYDEYVDGHTVTDAANYKKYKKSVTTTLETTTNAAAGIPVAVDAQGKAVFGTVGAGVYDLEETTVPSGYNPISPMKVMVVFNDPQADPSKPVFEAYEVVQITGTNNWQKAPNGMTFTLTDKGKSTTYKWDAAAQKFVVDQQGTTAKLSADIENHKGNVLPSTGGIGTTIFYVIGAILLVCAGVVLFARSRVKTRTK